MRSVSSTLSLLLLVCLARAAPAPIPLFGINLGSGPTTDGTPTPVSQSVVNSQLQRPAFFSRAVYCSPASVSSLSCGAPCDVINTMKVLASGGDGGETPQFFVSQDPDTQTIVVAHQGTDPEKILSIANDVEIAQVDIDNARFPSSAAGVKVHDGFQQTQNRTSTQVLSTVQSALSSTGFKRVLTTGHSLGAAVATLDAVMLRQQLSSDVEVDSVVFGLPRVGNQAFADMVDAIIPSFTHVTNQNDPVPVVPPRFLAYQHPQGEVHITQVSSAGDGTLEACPGQENDQCSEGNDLIDSSVSDHLGPYFNDISFGGSACPA
ncbi:alpha/beta-hydrolase [Cytidiella melzeri]|nr:alpha/beta-hydrolase [Cytidiella melzeri]